jgi:hypothetical protein
MWQACLGGWSLKPGWIKRPRLTIWFRGTFLHAGDTRGPVSGSEDARAEPPEVISPCQLNLDAL